MLQTKSSPTQIDLKQLSAEQLAEKYNISTRTAYRYRRKAGYRRNELRVNYCPGCGNKTDHRADYCLDCYRKRGRATYRCPDCGKEITRISTRCSTCYGKQRSKKYKGENSPVWKGTKTLTCLICKQPFEVRKGNNTRKLCSLDCTYRWRAQTLKGKASHLWQGGISFEPYDAGFNKHTKELIRTRDNYTCQLCQLPENGKAHPVHHIDYDKRNSSPSNLILLCSSCHTKTNYNREAWRYLLTDLNAAHIQTKEDYLNGKTTDMAR